jgi:hypothetical protein
LYTLRDKLEKKGEFTTIQGNPAERILWYRWLWINCLGMALGEATDILSLGEPVRGVAFGAMLGLVQWGFLKLQVGMNGNWILYSMVGAGVGRGIAVAFVSGYGGFTGIPHEAVIGTFTGLFLGFFQSIPLARAVQQSTGWMSANALGLAAGRIVGGMPQYWGPEGEIFGGAIEGGISGAITGVVLVSLLRKM